MGEPLELLELLFNPKVHEKMVSQAMDNIFHFVGPFLDIQAKGIKFDRLDEETIFSLRMGENGSRIMEVKKTFYVDTAYVACSTVKDVSANGEVIDYEIIEASFKYEGPWLLGSRSIFVDENERADRFTEEDYKKWTEWFLNIFWCGWNSEVQTIREHLELNIQYLPSHRPPINKEGLYESVVRTPHFPGVSLSFSPALNRVFVGLSNLFDEHQITTSVREVKVAPNGLFNLIIGLGVPELGFKIEVQVSPKIKGNGRPKKLENAIDNIALYWYKGRDLKEAIKVIVASYHGERKKKIAELSAKFSQRDKLKEMGYF